MGGTEALLPACIRSGTVVGGGELTECGEQAYAEADVATKWAASSWAKGIAKKAAKADMGDFDRFQLMVARKTRVRWRGGLGFGV